MPAPTLPAAPRASYQEALDPFLPEDGSLTMARLLDAILVVAATNHRGLANIAENEAYPDSRFFMDIHEAHQIVTDRLGDRHYDIQYVTATHRTAPLNADMDPVFLVGVLLLVGYGMTKDHTLALDLAQIPFDTQVSWAAKWGTEPLLDCVRSGYTPAELATLITTDQPLPDPATLATLRALRNQDA